MMTLVRVGPVFLWWSESIDAAVIGPEQGAWGGDDIYRCDVHEGWQGDTDDVESHVALHGVYIGTTTNTGVAT